MASHFDQKNSPFWPVRAAVEPLTAIDGMQGLSRVGMDRDVARNFDEDCKRRRKLE